MSAELGQYFTTHPLLKEKVCEFVLNNPRRVLEPSVGRGDLVAQMQLKWPHIEYDMYEIDNTLPLLPGIRRETVIYGDFLTQSIPTKYQTIIGNPPYVRTKKGNLYIDFVEKCVQLLDDDGELIFIVPSDFMKLTGASKLLNRMMTNGTFTHVYHPHNERLFENATIDIIVFRYWNRPDSVKRTLYNGVYKKLANSNGLITLHDDAGDNSTDEQVLLKDYFHVYVGLVSGRESVYRHAELGNIEVLIGENTLNKYIFIETYPCDNELINGHLEAHKSELMERKIRAFTEENWFEWGAPRNISSIRKNMGKECIYVYNLTRRSETIAFLGEVQYFGGNLIMLVPKCRPCNMSNVVNYLNSAAFRSNFTYSGRFKIGHRQLEQSHIPANVIHLTD